MGTSHTSWAQNHAIWDPWKGFLEFSLQELKEARAFMLKRYPDKLRIKRPIADDIFCSYFLAIN